MKKFNEYVLLAALNRSELSTSVSRLLNVGWELYGNPFSDLLNSETTWFQAMVKPAGRTPFRRQLTTGS